MTSAIDDMLAAARKVQPDLWERTEQVARIIDPAAFASGWRIEPKEREAVFVARLKMQQAVAVSKAQDVLKFLGVNTETDWLNILSQLANRARE